MGLTAFFSFTSFLWTLMHISFSKTCVPLLLIGLLLVLFTRPHSLHLRGSSFLPWHSLFSSGSSPMNVHRLILVQSQKAGETLAYSHVTQSVPVPIQSTNLFSFLSSHSHTSQTVFSSFGNFMILSILHSLSPVLSRLWVLSKYVADFQCHVFLGENFNFTSLIKHDCYSDSPVCFSVGFGYYWRSQSIKQKCRWFNKEIKKKKALPHAYKESGCQASCIHLQWFWRRMT